MHVCSRVCVYINSSESVDVPDQWAGMAVLLRGISMSVLLG